MVWKEEESTREQVSWNIAADQSKHLSDLIKKAMRERLSGNTGGCYWTLSGIRILINPWLEKKERIYFKKIEMVTQSYYSRWNIWKKSIDEGHEDRKLRENQIKFTKIVKVYFLKIMDLLRKLGYLPEKEDRTHLGF